MPRHPFAVTRDSVSVAGLIFDIESFLLPRHHRGIYQYQQPLWCSLNEVRSVTDYIVHSQHTNKASMSVSPSSDDSQISCEEFCLRGFALFLLPFYGRVVSGEGEYMLSAVPCEAAVVASFQDPASLLIGPEGYK